MKYKKSFLILSISISLIITSLKEKDYLYFILHESYVEYLQALVLIAIIFLTYTNKKIFVKKFGKNILRMRLLFFGFILYEELSYLSASICKFCDSFNKNGELNIHNLKLFENINNLTFTFPIIDNIQFDTIIYCIFFIFISYGGYIFKNNNLKGIFLEKGYSLFGCIFIITKAISTILCILNILEQGRCILIYGELIELNIYLVFLVDILDKIKRPKFKFT
ncbi:hypothetical protein [uncultured Prochlorococcus sp.]|uniref:hypothetical protein n=1 Tax=uncultured Prochlorococcus sp. TaxID=159733 RepID=UPI00258CA567|nr:hypothetical protein [uncultured Prochlorococcus sp.]